MPNIFPMVNQGLLSPEDQKAVRLQGLLGMASGLLDASGPSPIRRSLGQGISAGLTTGMAAMNNAQSRALQGQAFKQRRDALTEQQERQRQEQLRRDRFAKAVSMDGKNIAGNPVDVRRLYAEAFPEQAGSLYGASLKPKAPISVGGVLVDPETYEPILDTRTAPKPSSFEEKYKAAQEIFPSGTPADWFRHATKPGMVINPAQELTPEQKKISEGYAAQYAKIGERAESGRDTIRAVDTFEAGDFLTGPFAGTRLALGRLAQFVGVDPESIGIEGVADAESQQAASNKLAKAQRVAGEGVMSDSDFKILLASVMNINNTEEGNAKIAFAMRRAAERDIAKYRAANKWLKEKQTLAGFDDDWWERVGNKPLFTKDELMGVGKVDATDAPAPVVDYQSLYGLTPKGSD